MRVRRLSTIRLLALEKFTSLAFKDRTQHVLSIREDRSCRELCGVYRTTLMNAMSSSLPKVTSVCICIVSNDQV